MYFNQFWRADHPSRIIRAPSQISLCWFLEWLMRLQLRIGWWIVSMPTYLHIIMSSSHSFFLSQTEIDSVASFISMTTWWSIWMIKVENKCTFTALDSLCQIQHDPSQIHRPPCQIHCIPSQIHRAFSQIYTYQYSALMTRNRPALLQVLRQHIPSWPPLQVIHTIYTYFLN